MHWLTRRGATTWRTIAIALFAVALTIALVGLSRGESLADALDDLVLPILAASAVAAVLGLTAARWEQDAAERARRRSEAEREESEERLREAQERLEAEAAEAEAQREARGWLEQRERELEQEQRELEARLERRDDELDQERALRERVETWRQLERQWNEELRTQIAQFHEAQGATCDADDERDLVLRIAVKLVGAEKGLLLSRFDEDHDGDLDLVASHGFGNDPEGSAVTQYFAKKVLAQDETLRADDTSELELQDRTPADAEIENLLAIPIYMRDRFSGAVICANKPGGFHEYDDDVLLTLGDHAAALLSNARLRGDVRGAYLATVRVLADAIEAKDRFLRGHSNEVSAYVSGVAGRLGLEPAQREELIFASLLHDVGKIGITERILLKPAALTPEEQAVVELHPRIGARLIEQVPALRAIVPPILHHHERWDGEGYPARLRGEAIPLEARVIGVADAFSAMTAERPYSRRLTVDEACEELKRCAGTQFDPTIVRHFVEEIRRRPPQEAQNGAFPTALADPELASSRDGHESLLGFGAFSAVDNLTLLYSHRYLHEVAHAEAQRAVVQGRPFAVVVVELTDLARINRERGYAAGDEEIRAVAAAVQKVAARCGGTAARESGRRMCLLVPGAHERIAERLADEITSELGDGHSVRVRVAAWHDGDAGEDVVARAKLALAPVEAAT